MRQLVLGLLVSLPLLHGCTAAVVGAAATGVVVGVKSIARSPIVVRADHPFVFVIRDTRTGCLLFLGRVADPA